MKPGDIAFRCNFATADDDMIITDRRAGRIRSGTSSIARTINSMTIEGFEDVEIIFRESTGHRAVLVLRGPNSGIRPQMRTPRRRENLRRR